MKKSPFVCTLSIPLSLAIITPALSMSPLQIILNGEDVSFPDVQPYVDDGSNRTMVPAKFVTEQLGANVEWNAPLKQVTFTYQDQTIILTIGQNHAQVNGINVSFDAPAVIKNGRTMVPLRFISEMFEAQVDWIEQQNQIVVTTLGHAEAIPAPNRTKGTWIWEAKIIQTEQDDILRFAARNDLTSIYLHINRDMAPKVYQNFVRKANAQGIKVEALAGRPQWAYPDHQDQIKKFIEWVKKYNTSVGPDERFKGLHLDIEPYILKEWKTQQNMLIDGWMENMRFIHKEINASGLKITIDVPFWLYKVKIPHSDGSLSAWLLEKFDCLVIMDYRNFALGKDGLVQNAMPIIGEGSDLNKQVIVAVDTAKSSEGAKTTFFSLGTDAMEKELEKAKEEFSRYASYGGIAIHDYKNWMRLDE